MKIAIYSRKSKFTGKGDSVENQIQLCREYILHYIENGNSAKIFIYEDEGFSGGTAERPQFQQLLQDAKNKKFDLLVCYRLDRISRNIGDFSSMIKDLQSKNIGFISIREQFDTSTPMGRAMMYIASVFAQLERETIAERIRDNMIELAKTGRWLGGITPTGFESISTTAIDDHGRTRKAYLLKAKKEELDLVKTLFQKYLTFRSITKLEAYCLQNGLRSKNGKEFTRFTLRNILINPVYCCADEIMYQYFIDNGYEVYSPKEAFDGNHGVMAYNKTIQKKHHMNQQRNIADWIIAVGGHRPVIPSANWIEAQETTHYNRKTSVRKIQNPQSLLSGLLRCASCGSYMRPKPGRIDVNGNRIFYYMCERKERSRRALCSIPNANGRELDALVMDQIKKLNPSIPDLKQKLAQNIRASVVYKGTISNERKQLESKIRANTVAIRNLVENIASAEGTAASQYLIQKINVLHADNGGLKTQLLKLQSAQEPLQADRQVSAFIENLLSTFASTVDSLDIIGKRAMLHSIVDSVIWDGKNVTVNLFHEKK